MQIKYLQNKFYQASKLAYKIELSEEVRKKQEELQKPLLEKIQPYELLKSKKVDRKTIERITGISQATYYRYKKKIQCIDKGIYPPSKRPKRLRKPKVRDRLDELIITIRNEKDEVFGSKKIARLLRDHHNLYVGASTVERRIKALKEEGKIDFSKSCIKPKRQRTFNGHAKRWTYDMKKAGHKMGHLVQIDHMSVSINGVYVKHFAAIDPQTKVMSAHVCSNATSQAGAKFLKKVIEEMPFPIKSIQVDGGSEFMGEFEKACKDHNIELFVLPPKKPKYNGCVERSNRIFREEFYTSKKCRESSVRGIEAELVQAVKRYNTYRPHHGIGLETPANYAKKIMGASGIFSHML